MVTKIQKWGNSQGIRIPKYILDTVNFLDDELIDIITEDEKIVIQKVKTKERKNIKELFSNYDGLYTPVEVDWGEPVGKEIW